MENNIEYAVNQRIKILTNRINLTQTRISEIAQISEKTMSNIFRFKTLPTFKTLMLLLKAFPGLNARWLMLGEGEMWDFDSENDLDASALEAHDERLEYMVKNIHEPTLPGVLESNTMLLQEKLRNAEDKLKMMHQIITSKEQVIDAQNRELDLYRKQLNG